MSNKVIKGELLAPYTEKEKADFIVEYNHNQSCLIEELEDELIAYIMEATDEEKQQAERERLDQLSMTRGDVFEAMILARGIGKAQLRAMIEQAELDEVTKALYLNRFDEALEFYRGYPIFDMLGQALGITTEQLDRFFDTKDYHYLTNVSFEIKPNVENAIITINGKKINKISQPYNDETMQISYKVECEKYSTVEDVTDWDMRYNKTVEVVLEEEYSEPIEEVEEVPTEPTEKE